MTLPVAMSDGMPWRNLGLLYQAICNRTESGSSFGLLARFGEQTGLIESLVGTA